MGIAEGGVNIALSFIYSMAAVSQIFQIKLIKQHFQLYE